MSKSKFDVVTRSGIWSAYNNMCFYCSKPLEWDDLHIDHVIPELYLKDSEKLKQILDDFGIPNDFDLNGLSNLVPAHSRCNIRKSAELFVKVTTLYFLGLISAKITKVESEINKLQARKNKGQLISKLQTAISTNLLDVRELEKIIEDAKLSSFSNQEIKIKNGFEFLDAVYDSFYLNQNYQDLYNKNLLIGGSDDKLELIDEGGNSISISTLTQWKEAVSQGFYANTTYAIKMSAQFNELEDFLIALQNAKMPRYSFISEPWIGLGNLDKLSPALIQDFEGKLTPYIKSGISIEELVRKGVLIRKESQNFQLCIELDGIETLITENFRADFNDDGYEDIFAKVWVRAIGGTLGFGFTTILSRFSETDLLKSLDEKERRREEDFNITLWLDSRHETTIYYFQNNSNEPIMDAVLFIDKLGRTEKEKVRSRHSMEIVYGTVPSGTSLNHISTEDISSDLFGFPLLSGEFTSKNGEHFRIDNRNLISKILNRSSFD